jgi:hypothetical protein
LKQNQVLFVQQELMMDLLFLFCRRSQSSPELGLRVQTLKRNEREAQQQGYFLNNVN